MQQNIKTICHAMEKIGEAVGLKGGTFNEIVEQVQELATLRKNIHASEDILRFKGWHVAPCCTGCGTFLTEEQLQKYYPQSVSCCPERKMIAVMVPPGFIDRHNLEIENKAKGIERTGIYTPKDIDPALKDLVSSFAGVLAERLHKKRSEYGDAWKKRDWQKELSEKLHRANDPITAAAYAAFAWSHGWLIDPPDVVQNINIELTVNPEPGNVNVVTRIRDDILAQDLKACSTNVGFHQHTGRPVPESQIIKPDSTNQGSNAEWDFAQHIADFESVDAALKELVEDSTGDNGVRVVKAIYEALKVCERAK